jgi:hydroxymethylbilane synthase
VTAPLRIGTRGSRLALAQAEEIAGRLRALGSEVLIVPIVTSGDRGASPRREDPAGMKGLFVAEIVQALRDGDLDLAVHSAKDLPAADPEGVVVAAVPERADPLDVLVTREAGDLARDAVVGTSSLRRQAQLRRSRPGLRVEDLRGNVDTRLRKLEAGEVDGLLLAAAGLHRLGVEPAHATPMPMEEMVPAPGQGSLAVQAVPGTEGEAAARGIDHPRSHTAFEAERRLVARLGGGCALPLGAYAEAREEGVRLLAVVIREDGSDLAWAQVEADTAEDAAIEAAGTLEAAGAREMLAGLT